jgi:hypothetical protein
MEFLLFYAIPFFAGIAFLASLTAFIRPRATFYLRLLSLYLLLDCIVEAYTSYQALNKHNTQLINSLSSTVSFVLYIYVLREVIVSLKARRILLYCLLIFPLLSAVNIFLVQGSQVYQSITYSLGCLLIVTTSIYYFLELFQNKTYVNLVREPAFWICSGLLFYSACSFPLFAFLNFLITIIDISVIRVLVILTDLVNILLYLSFTIAFLCRLRPRKSI